MNQLHQFCRHQACTFLRKQFFPPLLQQQPSSSVRKVDGVKVLMNWGLLGPPKAFRSFRKQSPRKRCTSVALYDRNPGWVGPYGHQFPFCFAFDSPVLHLILRYNPSSRPCITIDSISFWLSIPNKTGLEWQLKPSFILLVVHREWKNGQECASPFVLAIFLKIHSSIPCNTQQVTAALRCATAGGRAETARSLDGLGLCCGRLC